MSVLAKGVEKRELCSRVGVDRGVRVIEISTWLAT